ncbi:MAG: HAMP domain-containing histidine kinase [Campylobacterales bacterium]|nr:HAMP domain-containing histidine kinase [Campylobacterales bacterium]
MSKLSIRIKLVLLFILFKLIPLIIISYIAILGAKELGKYFEKNTNMLFSTNKKIIETTANEVIEGSVKALDKTAQNSLERLSYEMAESIAHFLYERDNDLLFLSKIAIDDEVLSNFRASKLSKVVAKVEYFFDKNSQTWKPKKELKRENRDKTTANLVDNQKEFSYTDPLDIQYINKPIYKELTFVNLNGDEVYKSSSINRQKLNISIRTNTYINSENYFSKLANLKENEIFVSEVIGEYVGTKVIGIFNEENAKKSGVAFEPTQYAYAGYENPVGKKFEGIVRFATPVFKNGKKIGYLTMALDHDHLMNFTDSLNPTSKDARQVLSDGNQGNYAFLWDNEARCISHPRDYFIVGFDKKTGQRVPGWISQDVAQKFKESGFKDLNKFLENYPKFEEQSLSKKPNIAQLKELGEVGLDCRYLNFAPQCEGWMQLTQNGGYGSFIIYWSKVWKLTTAATIPYYTGEYGKTKRGFGFVTIGANVDEFHAAANETKQKVDVILNEQSKKAKESLAQNNSKIQTFIQSIINELSFVTVMMIIIVLVLAFWLSNYISAKIDNLIEATHKFSKGEFDYKITVTSKDEIGELENSFNQMALEIKKNKQQEHLLIQQSKMASMGEMIGNIAHQWRQPLSVISTSVTGLEVKMELGLKIEEKEIIENLHKVNDTVQFLSRTIDDFQDYLKPQKHNQKFNIKDVIIKNLDMFGKAFSNNGIEIVLDIEDIIINNNQNELLQVVINILNNAKDALKEQIIECKYIFIKVYQENSNAIISIKDNANGIPEKVLPNIFDAYFTTKHKSQGTGLGLYMSYQIIINRFKGNIEVKNEEYTYQNQNFKGANFKIILPLQ